MKRCSTTPKTWFVIIQFCIVSIAFTFTEAKCYAQTPYGGFGPDPELIRGLEGVRLYCSKLASEHAKQSEFSSFLPISSLATRKEILKVVEAAEKQLGRLKARDLDESQREKLSGFLINEGFSDVSQLEGGIIKYGQDEAAKGKHFEGKCYVFDSRVATESNFTDPSVIANCERCGVSEDRYVNCGYAPCNKQFFCCSSCEEKHGKFCSDECAEAAAHATANA